MRLILLAFYTLLLCTAVALAADKDGTCKGGLDVKRVETPNGTLNVLNMPNGKACVWMDGGRVDCDMPQLPGLK